MRQTEIFARTQDNSEESRQAAFDALRLYGGHGEIETRFLEEENVYEHYCIRFNA